MAVAVLFTASCAKEDISSSIGGGEVEVTFSASLPELGTRAYADGANAGILYYNVYDAATNEALPLISGFVTGSKVFTVNIPMLKGMTYDIVFWAQKEGTDYYTLIGKELTVKFDANKKNANDNDRDAFYAYVNDFNPATAQNEDTQISLYRPFGQLNAATSDYDNVKNNGVTLTTSSLKVTTFSKLNLETGVATDAVEVIFDATAMPCTLTPNKETLKNGYEYLSMNYLLPGTVDAEYTFKGERSDNSVVEFTGTTYTNVPVKANYRTNILGKLLTASTDFTVTIDPAFGVPDIEEWEQIADGVVLMNDTYLITSLEGLKWFAEETDGVTRAGGNTFKGKTVQLGVDIDLENEPWTPIASNGVFEGVFDGGNHTIKNLKVEVADKTPVGLFAHAKNVKNLKLENVDVRGHYKAGAVVGDGLCAKIENCHVKNAYIEITPLNEDDGNHAGGIVGYLSAETVAYVKNCSVTDANIVAYRDCGGIAGTANGGSMSPVVENNTLKDVYIVANQLDTYYAEKDANAGEVVGRNPKSIDLTSNICDNVNTDILKVVDNQMSICTATGLTCFSDAVDEKNTFADVTIKLENDIDLYEVGQNGEPVCFDPIGSYRNDTAFKGTFDGQGHTIKNLNQNTWALNNGFDYGDLGLGLFGLIGDGSVKNLVMDNANISGESAICGIVAATAYGDTTFENITVKNSKGADYQYYSGGIVGWASGNSKYIKCNIDASTTIAAQWGDFDNSTGGVIGGAGGSATILMKDCTVACRIDAYSDVTSSYQWYAYRRCGMLIGNPGHTTVVDGTTYAAAPQLTCENVTVIYGEWANYTYCEFAGTSWPYVRVQAGISNSAYSNPRYGHPKDANGNTVVDDNHVHNDGEDHHILIVFDQLYGGGQGVYGDPTHDGVTVIYNNK